MAISFTVTVRDPGSHARAGTITTERGEVRTPAFLPIGTMGTVKGVWPTQLKEMGYQCVLANTYHLYLRPGHERIRRLGGLHRFMGWDRPVLTDSGGYQVFSLSSLRSVSDDEVTFRSHIDGSRHVLSPELAVEVQEALGSDIRMVLDECVEYPAGRREVEEAVRRTAVWARRSLAVSRREEGGLFGIVQGGMVPEFRKRSAEEICALPFAGFAIGGVSVGEGKQLLRETVEFTAPLLPAGKPRYLMGVGTPEDILFAVSRGVDIFDCVLPTRNARTGMLFTSAGPVSIKQARYADDPRPPDERCDCPTCLTFSRAYLRHLYLQKEILSSMALTVHNLHFYRQWMERIREAISIGYLADFVKESPGLRGE
ncbi:MAG: tRNA guanosine(34) transglycosylase Tgt [Deltaproteobacteria bacterium]|nr:tRNA guanosine(34) transglycosylase Tgt [Deltaproteobacteria bacterium]MDH3382648.1 tRNA guanosine(34) transglycosylase Tgt [Deltaproteobacteria bacterium]